MILILTQCFPPRTGGIETLMGGLADAAFAAGREVLVLADGDGGDFDAGRGYATRRFKGLKPLRRRLKAMAARKAAKGADIVIADSWKSIELLRLPRGARPRVICLAHGMEFPAAPSASKRQRIADAFARADLVLANSAYTAGLARPYAASPDRLRVANPPIAPQPDPDPAIQAEVARRLDMDGAPSPMVATLCRLEPRKGVDRLIAATAALAERHPRLMLAVAGDGADRPRLEAMAAELGVANRVRFLGRVDEARRAALLAQADLFAMPARREGDSVEGFGIVYLEAGWYGAPSLAGREGGAPDAVLDGETGLLCDGADQASVTDALARMIEDREALARMGEAARAHARRQIWAERIADFLGA